MDTIRHLIFCLFFLTTIVVEERGVNGLIFAKVGDRTCMRVLGCFETTSDFFHLTKRPINLLPQNRAIINVQFLLYTNFNIREVHLINAENKETINSSHFDPNVPTKFIIHGYIDTQGFGPWQAKLKDEFLLKGKHNVIIVDWSGGNSLPYTQAVANIRVVGAEIAYLIQTLQKQVGLKPENCHILGHSLGAHAAGYAGERIRGLGRITGLDPAEPYFQGLPPSVRLDETDAQFVDVIHTDSRSIFLLGLGMSQAIGHVDFYPNGGKSQPGCKTQRIKSFITDGLVEGFRRFVGCDHQRAVDFYHSSVVLTKCTPVAYECSSWNKFLEGMCTECGLNGSRCAILGERAIESKGLNQKNKKLYVKTSNKKPYCIHHYKVLVKLYRGENSKHFKGSLELTFCREFKISSKKLTSSVTLFPGSTYTYLVSSEEDLGQLKSVSLLWNSKISLNPLNWFDIPKINIDFIKIIPMNVIDDKKRNDSTESFCPTNRNMDVYSGRSTSFYRNSKC